MRETDYENLQERYQKELDRGYLARRKGGMAWKQHCATLKNLERKIDLTLRKTITNGKGAKYVRERRKRAT